MNFVLIIYFWEGRRISRNIPFLAVWAAGRLGDCDFEVLPSGVNKFVSHLDSGISDL